MRSGLGNALGMGPSQGFKPGLRCRPGLQEQKSLEFPWVIHSSLGAGGIVGEEPGRLVLGLAIWGPRDVSAVARRGHQCRTIALWASRAVSMAPSWADTVLWSLRSHDIEGSKKKTTTLTTTTTTTTQQNIT